MADEFRILTWNCRHAGADSRLWEYLLELEPDLALLQDVGVIPLDVRQRYAACEGAASWGKTALLVRGEIGRPVELCGFDQWSSGILRRYSGSLLARKVFPLNGPVLKALSVYAPAGELKAEELEGMNKAALRLTHGRGVWLADVLLPSLEYSGIDPADTWVVAGDLNMCETMDADKRFAGGNREWLARISALGLTECLRRTKGVPTPTFRHSTGWVLRQLDHLFVTDTLASRLATCDTGSQERVFTSSLSDHLPILATFNL